MYAYIIKRVLLFIPTVIFISMIVFGIMRLIPGDPAIQLLSGELGDAAYTQEELDTLRAKLGTDKPIVEQYWRWGWGILQLDFGKSFLHQTAISHDLKKKFPITFELAILAILWAMVVAVPLGVVQAVFQDTPVDYIARIFTLSGVAFPVFWTAILLIYFLVLIFDWLPPLGYVDLWDDPGKNLQQLVFPALALGFVNMAFVARVTRSSMLEVFREDYIRTARSKGVTERVVIFRHALRNAMLPVISVAGWQFGFLIGGTVIVENIFLVPGVGRLLLDSIFQRDYGVTQGVVMVITLLVVLLNLVVDLLYGWLDPRIRYA